MIIRCWLPWLSLATALGLAGIWTVGHVRPAPAGGFEVDRPVRDLGECPAGEFAIKFAVTNRCKEPKRILGLSPGCGKNICIKAKDERQIIVLPDRTVACECLILVTQPGEFEVSVPLHLEEDRGVRTETLTVRGVGVAPTKNANGSRLP